jgi:hypothetical protein
MYQPNRGAAEPRIPVPVARQANLANVPPVTQPSRLEYDAQFECQLPPEIRPPGSRTLLIVHYQHVTIDKSAPYMINLMRPEWERSGWRVLDVAGCSRRVPADVVFLHVDLSLVPKCYQAFAADYPIAINASATDIRKTSYSRNRVLLDDDFEGPVVVKTALNHAGIPELLHRYPRLSLHRALARRGVRLPGYALPEYPYTIRGKQDYRIYSSVRLVPPEVFDCPDLIVEKFLPEMHGGRYCVREWYFLGDVSFNHVELSDDAISTFGEPAPHLSEPTPPELIQLRRELGMHYGKIDYAMRDGKPVLFDINKTIGTRSPPTELGKAVGAALAKGLRSIVG